MPERPARCYRRIDRPPYTRREYIKGFPPPKIRIFTMGSFDGEPVIEAKLIALEDVQIRHNALEAARVAANKYLSKIVGDKNYWLRIVPYPHHILRENKMMAFAGADRLQEGMRKAFGKPIGTAARVRKGQEIIIVKMGVDNEAAAKEALRRAASKLPTPCKIVINKCK
ncbi:MAG: 50S ribosomal protein L16 [Candidatus Baldrarchaeia archaeon]